MDRKFRKTDKIVKDRGDLKKSLDISKNNETEPATESFEDRGDSKTLDIVLKLGETDEENTKAIKKCCTTQTPNCALPPSFAPRRSERNAATISLLSDMAGRRELAERYTIRRKCMSDSKENPKDMDNKKSKLDGKIGPLLKPINADLNQNSIQTELNTKPKDHKKPVPKIISKEETVKLFKAVTFMETKSKEPINSGRSALRKPSRSSMKTVKKRKTRPSYKMRLGGASSPTLARTSPPTEVAKWAPSCLNGHTKPYYEAWVDTTLAAISKNAEKCSLAEQDIAKTLKAMQRPNSPDLVYGDVTDVNFTGLIKIKT